jgi:hypothetical protein
MMVKTQDTGRVIGPGWRARRGRRVSRGFGGLGSVLLLALVIGLAPTPVVAGEGEEHERVVDGRYCSATAQAIFRACGYKFQDDYWIAVAFCTNVSDNTRRAQCFRKANAARRDSEQLCFDQLAGRLNACQVLGEERYDPAFTPAAFDDDFTNLTNPNPYFPLVIGHRWEYRGGTETNTLEVLRQTKLIAGVQCIVVRDLVMDNGRLHEATDDWYAQAKDGNVWYCGEEVKNYENFPGDRPRRPELVNTDGAFKAGRDGAKPGIIFRAAPTVGESYIEEFSLGNAEDVTEIVSTTYSFGTDPKLDRFVPRQLARIFCAHDDCVVTKNYSRLEPGILARKYYARGIGVFFEVNPDTGEVNQLVNCNFDDRCTGLPTP